VSTPKVLIADDSPLVLRMIEKMLESAGFGVVTARDGLEAIDRVFEEDVGLVILDVMMPRMTGYQACRLLKSEPATRGVPVVILTSRDQAGDRFWGLQTGADYYVTKDADPQRILTLVKQIMADEAGRSRPRPEGRRTSMDVLSRVNELLDRKLYEATILTEISRVARSLVHFDETFTSVMGIVSRVLDYAVGGMAFLEGEELDVVLLLQRPASPPVIEEAKARLLDAVARHQGTGPLGKVQARLFAPGGPGMTGAEETSLGGFAAYPIVTNNRLTGLLALAGKAASRIGAETEDFLAQVANQAHIVVENSRLFDRVRNLSMRDSLTDLFNHRHSIELINTEIERVGRYEGGISILMIDIDNFKAVNDRHGHQAGDAILRETAKLMREHLRTVDSLGRYGGEEFVAVLPQTLYPDARQTAERIRVAMEGHSFRAAGRELRVTVSIGVATYPSDRVDSAGSLIREADQALYRAKGEGRNRVT
jgi:two-component system, cell cycle response regulator